MIIANNTHPRYMKKTQIVVNTNINNSAHRRGIEHRGGMRGAITVLVSRCETTA